MLLACFGGREKNKNQFDQNDVREKFIFFSFLTKKNIFVKTKFFQVMDGGLLGLTPNLNPDPSGDKIEPADFNNAFWGLKFHGYEVLHNSLKQ